MTRRRFLIPVVLLIVVSVGLTGYRLYLNTQENDQTQQVWRARRDWLKNVSTYSTTLTYDSPAGEETNPVKLIVSKGVVTELTFEITTTSKASINYQMKFKEELPRLILGKRIADLKSFDKISGASLTTTAFNEAIAKLQEQL